MNLVELSPVNDARSSFYGKAKVTTTVLKDATIQTLHSYDTPVAEIRDNGKPVAKVFGTYSTTTLRHIKEFLLQNGFKAENKKQILADYGV